MKVREKLLLWLGVGLGLALLAVALLGDQGWREVRRLRDERRTLRGEITRLREERTTLEHEIGQLRDNRRAIETRAREDLGMIRQGETVFLLPERHAPQH
jgi:cell division protein FtsB